MAADDLSDDDYYLVESIQAKRYNNRLKINEFLVKWLDYPSTDNTWEPEEHLANVPEIIENFEKKSEAKRTIRKEENKVKRKEIKERRKGNTPIGTNEGQTGIDFKELLSTVPIAKYNLKIDFPVKIIGCASDGTQLLYAVMFKIRRDGTLPNIGTFSHDFMKKWQPALLSEFLLDSTIFSP